MIYIGTDDGIFRWFREAPWPVYHGLQGRSVVSIAAPGAGILAAIDDGGRVWESGNNGLDWTELPWPAEAGRPLGVSLGPGGSVVLTTRPLGLFRRNVGAPIPSRSGPPWTPARLQGFLRRPRQGGGGTAVADRPAAASSTRVVEAAARAGWASVSTPTATGSGIAPVVRAFAIGGGEASPWLAAIRGAGLWRSTDGGASWTASEGLPTEVYAIRVAPAPSAAIWLATSDGARVSLDGGQTWEDRSGGLEAVRHLRAIEVHPEDPDVLLAGAAPIGAPAEGAAPRRGTRFALFESTDGGKSWKRVRRGFPEELEYDAIVDIRHDPAAPENAIVALDSGELWRTRNAGEWWEPIARQIRSARALAAIG